MLSMDLRYLQKAFFCCHGYSGYHGNQMIQQYILSRGMYLQYILSRGMYLPNMDLRYSHKAELLLKSLMGRVQTQHWMKFFKIHKKLETQSIRLKF